MPKPSKEMIKEALEKAKKFDLEKFDDNYGYIHRHEDELRLKYRGKIIAVLNRRIVDCDDDRDVLTERLKKRYEEKDFNSMAIEYLPKEKTKYLLEKFLAAC